MAVMKATIVSLLLLRAFAWADEAADRAAIEKTVAALNVWPLPAGLFTRDFDDPDGLVRPMPAGFPVTVNCPEIWRETCGMDIDIALVTIRLRRIAITKLKFLTPGTAMVDAVGPGPILILLTKHGDDWQIASIRALAQR